MNSNSLLRYIVCPGSDHNYRTKRKRVASYQLVYKILSATYDIERNIERTDVIQKIWISFNKSSCDPLFPYKYIESFVLSANGSPIYTYDGYILYLLHCLKLDHKHSENYRQHGRIIIPTIPLDICSMRETQLRIEMRFSNENIYESDEKSTCLSLQLQNVFEARQTLMKSRFMHNVKHWKHFVTTINENKSASVEIEKPSVYSTISRVLFVIENEKRSFDFFQTSLHPLKRASFVIAGHALEDGDESVFFIDDKIRSETFIPEIPIYSMTFDNQQMPELFSQIPNIKDIRVESTLCLLRPLHLRIEVRDHVPVNSKFHVFVQYETQWLNENLSLFLHKPSS